MKIKLLLISSLFVAPVAQAMHLSPYSHVRILVKPTAPVAVVPAPSRLLQGTKAGLATAGLVAGSYALYKLIPTIKSWIAHKISAPTPVIQLDEVIELDITQTTENEPVLTAEQISTMIHAYVAIALQEERQTLNPIITGIIRELAHLNTLVQNIEAMDGAIEGNAIAITDLMNRQLPEIEENMALLIEGLESMATDTRTATSDVALLEYAANEPNWDTLSQNYIRAVEADEDETESDSDADSYEYEYEEYDAGSSDDQ